MARGIADISRENLENLEHVALLEELKGQLLIVLLKRLGGSVKIPVQEVDDTGQDLLLVSIDNDRVFHFKLEKKQ